MKSQKESGDETVAQEQSQVVEPSFVAAPSDIDPEATVVDPKGSSAPRPPVPRVAVDDDPEATRLDAPRKGAPAKPAAPVPEIDDEATRINPPKAAPAPVVAAKPSPSRTEIPRPAAGPAHSSRGPLILVLVAIAGALLLLFAGARRTERPEDAKPLRADQPAPGRNAFRSLFDW